MKTFPVRNPYSGELLSELTFANSAEISRAIQAAVAAFQRWRRSSAWEKSQLLNEVALQLESQREEFAKLICQEAGKPIRLARAEVDRAIGVLRWTIAETQRFAGELLRLDVGANGRPGFGIHTRFPRGVVLGITPFNFPLNLVMHKVAPAVASGCSILIKPSPFTPLTAIRLVKIFETLMPGLVQVVLADDISSAELTRRPEISFISFTGSTKVGWRIRQQAPEKPTTLELGGNAWVIVLEDTPASIFPAIAQRLSEAAFGYAGQSCISVQNVAVASSVWNDFQKQLKTATLKTPYGDPSLPSVVSGPVIHEKAADRIRAQLLGQPEFCADACEWVASAQKEVGKGSQFQDQGMIAPTLVLMNQEAEITDSSSQLQPAALTSLVQEEIFGPVMTARPFHEVPGMIQKINSSRYGLQAGVYTQNLAAIEKLYQELEVGGLVVNDVPTTRYDHQPYGGVKESGQGREGVRYAMDEMTESKFLALSSFISA